MTLAPIYCGVDTLECTFDGTLREGLTSELDIAKKNAQATDTPAPFPIGEQLFYAQAFGMGKAYAWVLSDGRMQLRISRAKKGIPVVSVRLWAQALATFGHVELYRQAREVVSHLGELDPFTLSRIDLCADVQGLDFTGEDFEALVCPASLRSIHREGEGITYKLGKGDVVVRIYRKDAELRARNKLSYAKVWEHSPTYMPNEPVWRIEVQLRGAVLKELAARSVDVAFSKLGTLFAFGLEWCQLRVPGEGTNPARWPVDPRWALISGFWGAGSPEPRIRKAAMAEGEERVVGRLTGALAGLAAYSGHRDLLSVLEYALVMVELRLKEREEDFPELVEKKVARIASTEGVPF